MVEKKIIKKIDTELFKYFKSKYSNLNSDILDNIILEKKKEILYCLENDYIQIKNNNDIIDLLEKPIYDLAFHNFKDIIKIKQEKKNKLENVSYSNAYKCFKCGNNKTSVVYVQTRSCDEPMTAFVKCIKCQNQFVK